MKKEPLSAIRNVQYTEFISGLIHGLHGENNSRERTCFVAASDGMLVGN